MKDFQCPNECGCDRPFEMCECRCHELDTLLEIEQSMNTLLEEAWEDFSHDVRCEIITSKGHVSTAIRAHLARTTNDANS